VEELLVILLQFLFELVINVLGHLPFDWPSRKRRTPEREQLAGLCLLWLIGGGLLGFVSLLVFDYTLLRLPALRFANLLVSPLLSGFLAQSIAARRAKRNPLLIPGNHFWYGFWFSLGIALVRFMFAGRV
jgi:hypothetical protein